MTLVQTKKSRIRLPRRGGSTELPEGALACRDCGAAVRRPITVEKLTSYGVVRVFSNGAQIPEDRKTELTMTRCDACSARLARAEAITDAHPLVMQPLGARSYALALVDAALTVFDALGMKPARAAMLTRTDNDLRQMLDLLPAAGSHAWWVAKFVPTMGAGVDPRSCAPSRWGHIPPALEQRLRDSYAALLRARTDKPIQVRPPDGRACLLCGIGAVMGLPSTAEHLWGCETAIVAATVGGRGRPEPISGYLCPECGAVADSVGAIGPTVLERSLAEFLGVHRSDQRFVEIDGIRAWAVLPDGTPPNKTRWAHEPNLEELAKDILSA